MKRKWIDFYGGGKASERIVEVLKNYGKLRKQSS